MCRTGPLGATTSGGVRAASLLAFLAVSLAISLARHLQVLDRWQQRPLLAAFPLVGLLAGAGVAWGWRRGRDRSLFLCGAVIFAAAFGTLAASFLPYMVSFVITIDQAAAPPSSLTFMFWGAGVVVLPLTLAYTAAVYFIFRGRVLDADGDDEVGHASTHLSTRLPLDAPTTAAGRMLDDVASMIVVLRLIRDVIRLPRGPRNPSGRPK